MGVKKRTYNGGTLAGEERQQFGRLGWDGRERPMTPRRRRSDRRKEVPDLPWPIAAEAMDGVRVRCRASSSQPLPAAGFLGIGVADGEALSNRPLDEQRDELLLEVLLQHLLRRRLQRRGGLAPAQDQHPRRRRAHSNHISFLPITHEKWQITKEERDEQFPCLLPGRGPRVVGEIPFLVHEAGSNRGRYRPPPVGTDPATDPRRSVSAETESAGR